MGKDLYKIEIRVSTNKYLPAHVLMETEQHSSLRQAKKTARQLAERMKRSNLVLYPARTAALIFDSDGEVFDEILFLDSKYWLHNRELRKPFLITEETYGRQPDKSWLTP